jgi:hypothetical protein
LSTILKALRRLERERTQVDGRPLREQVTGLGGDDRGEESPSRRWPILLLGIGVGVAAGLSVLSLWLGGDEGAQGLRAAAPAQAPPPAGPATAAATAAPPGAPVSGETPSRPLPPFDPAPASAFPAMPSVAEPAPLEIEPIEEVAVIERGPPAPRIASESPPPPRPEPAEPPPGSVRPFPHASPEPRAPAPGVEPPPAKRPAPAAKAAVAPASAFSAPRVSRTTWHPVAERRTAVVELPGGGTENVREGQLVAGVLVKRIEPSGVLFERAGRELRRTVGE